MITNCHEVNSEVNPFASIAVAAPAIADATTIIIIDDRVLVRDCLAQCLKNSNLNCQVFAFDNVEQWLQAAPRYQNISLILMAVGGRKQTDTVIERDLPQLSTSEVPAPVVVMSDAEDFDCILGALQGGAKGYIPTSIGLSVAMGALQLVKVGGSFIPANTLTATRQSDTYAKEASRETPSSASFSHFTQRQTAVVNALRQGKANKTIAYELNMCESTVKVHVRNIMKKLKAKNRTEVAYIYNNKFSPAEGVSHLS